MSAPSFHPLGPVSKGSQRAALGLKVISAGHAEPVVLVWVPKNVIEDSDLLLRIKRETSRAMVLEHPNIVRVHGLYNVGDTTARIVDYVDGEPLRKVLDAFGGKLPLALAARVVADAALGVHFAHEAGYDDGTPLLHGDIRPETVMVSFTGVSKISGYGALVVAPRDAENLRKLHVTPEQVLGGREAISRQTDVYLLGLLLHVCLTGKVPFEGSKDFDRAVLSEPLPFFSPSEIPPEVASLLERALAKRATSRFDSAMALREALERAVPSIASHESLSWELTGRFPEDSPERLERKTALATGMANLVSTKWKEPKAASVSLAQVPSTESGRFPAQAMEAEEVERSSARGWAVALLVLMLLVAGGGFTVWEANPAFLSSVLPGVFPSNAPVFEVADAGATLSTVEVLDAGTSVEPPIAQQVAEEAAATDAGSSTAQATLALAGHSGVDVATDPAMDLKFDGMLIGRGHAVVNTEAGRHTLMLIEPHTQLSVARVVYVPENGKARLRLSVGRAFVTINAPEGSMIFLDEKKIGFAPMRGMIPVLEGSHVMAVRVGQSRWQEEFNLKAGQKIHFDVSPD